MSSSSWVLKCSALRSVQLQILPLVLAEHVEQQNMLAGFLFRAHSNPDFHSTEVECGSGFGYRSYKNQLEEVDRGIGSTNVLSLCTCGSVFSILVVVSREFGFE